tara:strand:+ start:301 stop:444 length:144 start_codon:yes stop_codon:yes gene_type:complete
MLEEVANYMTIVIALALVNVVWQLEKAGRILTAMNNILKEQMGMKND